MRSVGTSALARAADAYLDTIALKGFSRYTVAYRERLLERFCRHLAEQGVHEIHRITAGVLDTYTRALLEHRTVQGRTLSLQTQAAYLVAVKGFVRWLWDSGQIRDNVADRLIVPRVGHVLPRTVLSVAQIEATLGRADVNTPIGLRDRTILETLYSTGVRRTELCRLRTTDVDHDRRTVTVIDGKGRRDRVVPIGRRALQWIALYGSEARPRLALEPPNAALFLTIHGNDITPDHLTQRVGDYIRTATGRSGSCHSFRHTMATLLLDHGADIRHIQEILGHVDLTTTQIYTHVSITQLAAVHARCHPAGDNFELTTQTRRAP